MATVRRTRGDDIDAACGQLAGRVHRPHHGAARRQGHRRRGAAHENASDRAGVRCACAARGRCARAASAPAAAAAPRSDTQARRHANMQLGIAYLQQGNLALAKEKLERALEQDPQQSRGAQRARRCCTSASATPKAPTSEYRTALRLAPNDPDIINNYAVYLCQNGRTDEGVKRFEAGGRQSALPHALRPPTPTPACACARAKRDDEARAAASRARCRSRPNYPEAVRAAGRPGARPRSAARGAASACSTTYLGQFGANSGPAAARVRVARAQQGPASARSATARSACSSEFPDSDQARALPPRLTEHRTERHDRGAQRGAAPASAAAARRARARAACPSLQAAEKLHLDARCRRGARGRAISTRSAPRCTCAATCAATPSSSARPPRSCRRCTRAPRRAMRRRT